MSLISVITAVYEPVTEYLRKAASSVAALKMPARWELEWLVQEDGNAPNARDLAAGARYEANGARLGTATTRNLALSRARGQLVAVLDYDDVLLPDGLATLIKNFLRSPGSIGSTLGRPQIRQRPTLGERSRTGSRQRLNAVRAGALTRPSRGTMAIRGTTP
jgi:glycosyltransferase involved in cell wall biosynthesis